MPTLTRTGTLLVADDDFVVRQLLVHNFERVGLHPEVFEDGEQLVEAATEETLVAVVDLRMPKMSGMDCLKSLKKLYPKLEVIVLTAVNQASEAIEALREGAFDYITKPFEPEELILAVRKAMQLSRTARENQEMRHALDEGAVGQVDVLGQSPAIQRLKALTARVAPSHNTVLITGENGTGKGVLARAIHAASPRSAQPFVSVSCPSLPKDLLESELFGHEKGAFSGAVQRRLGRAEMAHGGTLFLDEIGELPLDLQPKFLSFLQEKTFYRIGGQKLLHSDIRLIAATNRNLQQMVAEGTFREDLYFRLHVLPLEVPPLRERGDDILLLAEHFLARASARAKVAKVEFSGHARQALSTYPWPGNVRQLENAIERAFTLRMDERRVDLLDLPPEVAQASKPAPAAPARGQDPGPAPTNGTALGIGGLSLDELEKRAILETLSLCRGNKAETARVLGITEKSIYNKMRRHGLM